MPAAPHPSAARMAALLLALVVASPAALAHKGHREAREEKPAAPAPEVGGTVPGPGQGSPGAGAVRAPAGAAPAARAGTPDARPAGGGGEAATASSEEGEGEAWPPPGVPRPLAWLGKFHPPLTHFPIALLTAAALAELLAFLRPDPLYAHAARFCVLLGGLGAVAAALIGWFFGGFTLEDDEWVMTAHRIAGTATAVVAALAVVLSERFHRGRGGRRAYLAALFAAAALVGLTGFLGGALVYGLDHYAW